MVAAICLVGINATFSGGCCSQAVLQNWSVLVSGSGRLNRPSGEAACPGRGAVMETNVLGSSHQRPLGGTPGRTPGPSSPGVNPPPQVILLGALG